MTLPGSGGADWTSCLAGQDRLFAEQACLAHRQKTPKNDSDIAVGSEDDYDGALNSKDDGEATSSNDDAGTVNLEDEDVAKGEGVVLCGASGGGHIHGGGGEV
ncbi:hypothetical protein HN51_004980 [Arachis hypogaea]